MGITRGEVQAEEVGEVQAGGAGEEVVQAGPGQADGGCGVMVGYVDDGAYSSHGAV